MAAFDRSLDFADVKRFSVEMYDFLTKTDTEELEDKIPKVHTVVEGMVAKYIAKYPPKIDIAVIATNWNDLFREGKDPYSFGVDYGWLNCLLELENFRPCSDYIPYHFKVGLAQNKGHFSIEENFLLSDAFNQLVKGLATKDLLVTYSEELKKTRDIGNEPLAPEYYTHFSNLKFEIAAYARTSVVTFYSFVECFVNSLGYSHLMYSTDNLSEPEQELLKGKNGKHYLSLKEKIRAFPKLINPNHVNPRHFGKPEQTFFDIYEDLRNSAVHYSPVKSSIWLKPDIWLEKAKEFSEVSIGVALTFWKDCFPESDGPEYLGKLQYERLHKMAEERLADRRRIEASVLR